MGILKHLLKELVRSGQNMNELKSSSKDAEISKQQIQEVPSFTRKNNLVDEFAEEQVQISNSNFGITYVGESRDDEEVRKEWLEEQGLSKIYAKEQTEEYQKEEIKRQLTPTAPDEDELLADDVEFIPKDEELLRIQREARGKTNTKYLTKDDFNLNNGSKD